MAVELINIDCMEYMKGLEDNSFDLCITSPPYNMNLRVNAKGDGYCSRQIVKELSSKYENYSDNLTMAEYEAFLEGVLLQLIRVSRLTFFNVQIITGNKPALFRLIGKFSEQIKELIIWDKGKAQPAIGEGVLNSQFELVLVLGDRPITRAFTKAKFQRGCLSNIWNIQPKAGADKTHKAAFPVELVEKILGNFEGNNLFDPFMGTGTTAIAAHYGGFDFVGCELDEDYYKAACNRFDLETAQEDMFSGSAA